MKENSIEEALEKLSTGKKIKMYELLRTFKREGIENFVITRKKYVDVILSDYKRVLKENEELISDNLEYQRIQDIFDKRTYRKKYLEERRKEEPNLLYPDADEIYRRYYELQKENQQLRKEINRENKKCMVTTEEIEDIIAEIKAEKLNYSENEYYLENEIKGYAIDKLKELLESEE